MVITTLEDEIMKKSVIMPVSFLVVILVATSFNVVAGSQQDVKNVPSITATYLLQSNNVEMVGVSNVTLFNSSWVYVNVTEISQGNAESFNSSSYLLPISALQVSIHRGENTSLSIPGIRGTITTYSISKANSAGLVTYGYVRSTDSQAGIDSFWSASLVKESGSLFVLNNTKTTCQYYVFLPELLPPSSFSKLPSDSATRSLSGNIQAGTASTVQSDPSSGTYAKLRLNEHDPLGLGLWYIFSNLSYNNNMWGVSGNAVIWAIDWQVWESYTPSIQLQSNGGWNGSGYAEFYGTFPWGNADFWYALPTVSVTWFSSNSTFVGYVNDLVLAQNDVSGQIFTWKDGIWKNSFTGSVTVTDVITDQSGGPS